MNEKERKDMTLTEIAKNIRVHREAKGWTQMELAEKCGYKSDKVIIFIENVKLDKHGFPRAGLRGYHTVSKTLGCPCNIGLPLKIK